MSDLKENLLEKNISKANDVVTALVHRTAHYVEPLIHKPITQANRDHVSFIINHAPNSKLAAKGIELYAAKEELDLRQLTKDYSDEHKLLPSIKASKEKGKGKAMEFNPRAEFLLQSSNTSTSPNDILAAMAVSATSVPLSQNKSAERSKPQTQIA